MNSLRLFLAVLSALLSSKYLTISKWFHLAAFIKGVISFYLVFEFTIELPPKIIHLRTKSILPIWQAYHIAL